MSECVIVVRFELEAGRREAFLPLIEANARASVADEPCCRRFDVLLPEGEADTVLLYEVYDDAAAFERHRGMPHFARFNDEAGSLIRAKQITVASPSANSPAAKG